jgi:hypothetical protein
MIYYKKEEFISAQGAMLTVYTLPQQFEENDENPRLQFVGTMFVQTDQGGMPLQFPFPDDCKTIESCFEQFQPVAEKFFEEQI